MKTPPVVFILCETPAEKESVGGGIDAVERLARALARWGFPAVEHRLLVRVLGQAVLDWEFGHWYALDLALLAGADEVWVDPWEDWETDHRAIDLMTSAARMRKVARTIRRDESGFPVLPPGAKA